MTAAHIPATRVLATSAMTVGFACSGMTTVAHAQPPGFPDLNAFREVDNSASFAHPDRSANGYLFFTTPDGISCAIGSTKSCRGSIPGLPSSGQGPCMLVIQRSDAASQAQPFKFESSDRPCDTAADKLLNPGQKLTAAYGTTCVVGDGNLTACIDTWHDHGFVLQPSGSWVF